MIFNATLHSMDDILLIPEDKEIISKLDMLNNFLNSPNISSKLFKLSKKFCSLIKGKSIDGMNWNQLSIRANKQQLERICIEECQYHCGVCWWCLERLWGFNKF